MTGSENLKVSSSTCFRVLKVVAEKKQRSMTCVDAFVANVMQVVLFFIVSINIPLQGYEDLEKVVAQLRLSKEEADALSRRIKLSSRYLHGALSFSLLL